MNSIPNLDDNSCNYDKSSLLSSRYEENPITMTKYNDDESSSFDDLYELDEIINEGCYGTVYTAYHNRTDKLYAVKVINRCSLVSSNLNGTDLQDEKSDTDASDNTNLRVVLDEVSILRDLQAVPNIIKIEDFFVDGLNVDADERFMYIVTNFVRGGDMVDHLNDYTEEGRLNEIHACQFIYSLLKTIKTLHIDYNVVHRDIKPDNLLLNDPNDYSSLVLCDFGFATYLPKDKSTYLTRRCGSLAYTAPEIVLLHMKPSENKNNSNVGIESTDNECGYREEVDMWGIGCVLYLLLTGDQAFDDDVKDETFRSILSCSYYMDDEVWDTISDEAKELVENLLVFNPNDRWSVQKALDCNWIKNNMDYLELEEDIPFSPGICKNKRVYDSFKSIGTEATLRSISYDSL